MGTSTRGTIELAERADFAGRRRRSSLESSRRRSWGNSSSREMNFINSKTTAAAEVSHLSDVVAFGKDGGIWVCGGKVLVDEQQQRPKTMRTRTFHPRAMTLSFLTNALVSFVGVVVIPTRFTYDLLLASRSTTVTVDGRNHDEHRRGLGSSVWRGGGGKDGTIHTGEGVSGAVWVSLGMGDGAGEKVGDWRRKIAKRGGGGRALMQASQEEASESFTYTAKTQFFLCSEVLELPEETMQAAVMEVFSVDESQITGNTGSVALSGNVEFCGDSADQWAIAIGNEADGTRSASSISAEQMDIVREAGFTGRMAKAIVANGSGAAVTADDLSYSSLGYIITFDEDQASASTSNSLGDDFQDVLGPDQYWPWWAWLLFGLGVLCCCPVAFCIYHHRPGRNGPPSPSGPAGGLGMFGGKGKGPAGGAKGDGMDPYDMDFNLKDFEKNAGYADKGDGGSATGFNDTATVTDSPSEYVNPTSVPAFSNDAEPGPAAEVANRQIQGDWPEASSVLSEADRAAGVDPNHEDMHIAPSSAEIAATASIDDFQETSSSASIADSTVSGASGVGVRGATVAWATGAGAMGAASGRSLGDAAAALRGSDYTDSVSNVPDAPSGRQLLGGSSTAIDVSEAGPPLDLFDGGGSQFSMGGLSVGNASFHTDGGFAGGPGDAVSEFRDSDLLGSDFQASDFQGSNLEDEEARVEREAYEAALSAESTGNDAAGTDAAVGLVVGAAAVAAARAAATLPPSGRQSGSRHSSLEPTRLGEGRRPGSRATSHGSTEGGTSSELRELTDEERQQRVQESDAARAASVLRGSSFRVPMEPDLARLTTDEEQERRRHAVEEVEKRLAPSTGTSVDTQSRDAAVVEANPVDDTSPAQIGPSPAGFSTSSPPSTATSVVGKVLAGMGMSRFFGISGEDASTTAQNPPLEGPSPSSQATAPAAGGAGGASVSGGLRPVAESPASAAARIAATTATDDGDGGGRGTGGVYGTAAVGGAAAAALAAAGAVAADQKDRSGEGVAAEAAAATAGRNATTDDFQTSGGISAGLDAESLAQQHGEPAAGPRGSGPIEGAGESTFGVVVGTDLADSWLQRNYDAGGSGQGVGTNTAALAARAAATEEAALRGRSLSPEEVQAYSDNVDRTLQDLDVGQDGGESMPMSELLARAEVEERAAQNAATARVEPSIAPRNLAPASEPILSAAPSMAETVPGATSAAPPVRTSGLPPPGPGQAAALALQQQSAAGSNAPKLDLARLFYNAEEGGMTFEDVEACLASPIVATPPALLRPGVGPAARGAAGRGRGQMIGRPGVSGSFVSSRSTSVTSNNNNTEDDMSSGQTTDVSRTSSYHAQGSFEESLLAAQQMAGHHGSHYQQASAAQSAAPAGAQGSTLSSLAEHLARAEDKVPRGYEKGLLYRQGPEGVAAAVTGEQMPIPAGAAAAAGRGGAGASSGGARAMGGLEKVESLADMLAQADDGPGNLKELFRRLDDMEAKRLEELNALASADGADDETKARWRGSLAELMAKADRTGHLRGVLDIPEDAPPSESAASEGNWGPEYYNTSASSTGSAMWETGASTTQDTKAQDNSRSE